MTLPSAHHGAIFAQAPRAVHRTLVRGRASLKGLARGTTIPNARGSCAGERSAVPPPPLPGPWALDRTSETGAAYVPSPPFQGGEGQGEVGFWSLQVFGPTQDDEAQFRRG